MYVLKKFILSFTGVLILFFVLSYTVLLSSSATRHFLKVAMAKDMYNSINKIYEEFLPMEAKIITSSKIDGEKSIVNLDLDNDKEEETLIFYEIDKTYEKGFVVLKNVDGKLKKVFEDKEQSGKINKVDFIHIYKGEQKSLLVGYFISDLGGTEYKAFTFNNKKISSLNLGVYNRMDILNTPDESKNKDFIFGGWNRIGPPELYVINVIRFDGKNFTLAYDFYENYFKDVVKYYENKNIKIYPLIDAMIKSNMNEEALMLIEEGLEEMNKEPGLSYIYDKWDYYLLKSRALNGLKRYDESKEILECILNSKDIEEDKSTYYKDEYLSKVYFEVGITYKGLNKVDKAKESFVKSLGILNDLDKKGYFQSNLQPNVEKEVQFYPVENELKNLRK